MYSYLARLEDSYPSQPKRAPERPLVSREEEHGYEEMSFLVIAILMPAMS